MFEQGKFYHKFTRPDEAHAFFDVNGDGDIDEAEFYDVLRYAGCWNGFSLGRATFKALTGEENEALSVRDFVDRLLAPDEHTEKEINDRLRLNEMQALKPVSLNKVEHDIMTRFTAQLAQQRKHMNFSVRPLFRKMKSDGSGEFLHCRDFACRVVCDAALTRPWTAGFLTYDEFRDVIGQDCLNLGFNDAETSVLIDAVDTGGKGAITYSDLSRRLATADVGRDHDAMLASSTRELQVCFLSGRLLARCYAFA